MGYINEREVDGELLDDGPDGCCNECGTELIEIGDEHQQINICPVCGD